MMTELELDLSIAEEAIREAEECFTQLREDYHALREHTDVLVKLLSANGIEYPDFWS